MPRPKLQTDAQILEATARAIGKVGPSRLTLADVASEVGLAPATLIQRFGSKRGLLLAFARQSNEPLREEFSRAKATYPSALDALVEVSVAQTRAFESAEALANHLAFLQLDLNDPEFRGHAVKSARMVRGEIRELLETAVTAGELEPCDTAALARAVQALFGGSLIFWAMHRRGSSASWVRKDLETLLEPYRRRPQPAARIARGRSKKNSKKNT